MPKFAIVKQFRKFTVLIFILRSKRHTVAVNVFIRMILIADITLFNLNNKKKTKSYQAITYFL